MGTCTAKAAITTEILLGRVQPPRFPVKTWIMGS